MMQPRDFSQTEISEINKFIVTNVPHSALSQFYAMTENPLNKAKIYTAMFRIVYGAYDYVEAKETKDKIRKLLDENRALFTEVFTILIKYETNGMSFGQNALLNKLRTIYMDFEKNFMINTFINIFLVFIEKIVLTRTDNFVSIDLESKEGEEVYKKLANSMLQSPEAEPELIDEEDEAMAEDETIEEISKEQKELEELEEEFEKDKEATLERAEIEKEEEDEEVMERTSL